MLVLLHPEEYDQWLTVSLDDVLALRSRLFPPNMIEMTPAHDPWIRRKAVTPAML